MTRNSRKMAIRASGSRRLLNTRRLSSRLFYCSLFGSTRSLDNFHTHKYKHLFLGFNFSFQVKIPDETPNLRRTPVQCSLENLTLVSSIASSSRFTIPEFYKFYPLFIEGFSRGTSFQLRSKQYIK